jgi:hypothetical protein
MQSSYRSKLTDYDNPRSLGSRLRAKRAGPIMELIDSAYRRRGQCRVLDLGGTLNYWNILPEGFLRDRKVRITLLNVKAVPVDGEAAEIFESVAGDACDMRQYGDGEFDLAHSNSVIEHVGLWGNMERMASEVRRVGRAYYVQTPNYWFPIEPHYLFPCLHWMPFPWRIAIARSRRLGGWPRAESVGVAVSAQQAAILLTAKMLAALFPDAVLSKERFFGLPKSLIAVRAEAAA